jgi:hypothetical protein
MKLPLGKEKSHEEHRKRAGPPLISYCWHPPQLRLPHLSRFEAVTKLVPSAEADSVHSTL